MKTLKKNEEKIFVRFTIYCFFGTFNNINDENNNNLHI